MATINSGITMRIIPLITYQFAGIAGGSHLTIPLGYHIEAGPFTEVDLLVRLHTGTSMVMGQSVAVSLYADGYDFEDPTSVFLSSSALATVTLTYSNTFPSYSVISASASSEPFGRFLAVAMLVTQASTAATLNVNISVDMTLKGGDPTAMPMAPNSYRGYRIM